MSKAHWLSAVLWHFLVREPFESARAVAAKKLETALLAAFMGGMFGASAIGFLVLMIASNLLGVDRYLFPNLASQQIEIHPTIATKHTWPNVREKHLLSLGHRCARKDAFVSHPAVGMCVNSVGLASSLPAPAQDNWMLQCCSAVVPGSDKERLAALRRIQPNSIGGRGALLVAYSVGFGIALGVLAGGPLMVLIAARFALWTPVLQGFRFATTFGHGMRNLARALRAKPLKAANFQLSVAPHSRPVVCQLTDLHIVEWEAMPEELQAVPAAWPSEKWGAITGAVILARAEQAFSFAKELLPCAVVVTGDVTDLGIQAQWQVWKTAIETTGPWGEPTGLHVIPGNHDLMFNPPQQPDPACSKYEVRKGMFDRATLSRLSLSSPAAQPYNTDWRLEMREFPEVHRLDHKASPELGIHLVLLNSNLYPSQHSMSGALGELGSVQLDRLGEILNTLEGPLIVAMHHHLSIIEGEGLGPSEEIQDRLMLTLDGERLLEILRDYSRRAVSNPTLVIHGHRHRLSFATDRSGSIKIFGLPSSTLGMHIHQGGISGMDGEPRVGAVYLTAESDWAIQVHTLVPSSSIRS